jgi:hypothetical protein
MDVDLGSKMSPNQGEGNKKRALDIMDRLYTKRNKSPPIELSLGKKQSSLDGGTLLEYVPKERIKALLRSNKLVREWENPSYSQKHATHNHSNEIEQMKAYLAKYNDKLGAALCKYVKPKHKWGRVHPVKSIGLTSFGVKVRNTLIRDLYYDIDLKNAQVEIVRNICQKNDIECQMVADYCTRRDEILKEIMVEYNVTRKCAKKLILRLCFFGTFEGWVAEQGLTGVVSPWITCFISELHEIAHKLKFRNPVLYESARQSKEAKNKEKNVIGSFFALYLQEWEFRIVGKVINWLISNTDVMKHPNEKTSYHVGVYEYDGIKLLKENVDKCEGGLEGLRWRIIEKTRELTGFELQWEEKPIEKFHDITHELELVKEDDKDDDELIALCDAIRDRFTDVGVIESIQEILPDHFVYCNNQWYGWTGEKWEPNHRPLELAIMYDLPKYWKSLLKPFKAKYPEPDDEERTAPQKLLYGVPTRFGHDDGIVGELEKFIKHHLSSNHGINGCVGRGKVLLAHDDLEFDHNPNLLGFNNGLYDIDKEVFRPARFDDYVSWSCGWNFRPMLKGIKYMDKEGVVHQVEEEPSGEDLASMNELKRVLGLILPYEDVRHLVLFIFASGLSGRAIEKFFIFNGAGRNGKGLLNAFMGRCLGDYAVTMCPIVLTESKRLQNSGSANPEKAKLDKKRFIVTSEPAKAELINNDAMKDLTGGGEIQARALHSNNTRVLLFLTLIMECNEKPGMNEAPTLADGERIIDILFPSFFTFDQTLWDASQHVYPKDPFLKTTAWRDRHKNAFMNTLISYLLILKNEANYNIERYVPESVEQRGLAYLQDSFDIHNIFTSLFEKRRDEVAGHYIGSRGEVCDEDWSLSAVVKHLRGSREFMTMTKRKQNSKEMKAAAMKTFFQTNVFYKNDVYTNSTTKQTLLRDWRLKVDDDMLSCMEYPSA